ncbi:SPASM domain-containing protein, partial [Thermodesulfobacteriota bacterium]
MRGVQGAWRKTWRGIDRLQTQRRAGKNKPIVAVNTVVTRKNIEHLPQLYRLLLDRGIDSWRLLPVRTKDKKLIPKVHQWRELASLCGEWQPLLNRSPVDNTTDACLEQSAKGRYGCEIGRGRICFAPWFSVFIDADGALSTCCSGRQTMPAYGNVLTTSVEEALSSSARLAVCSG